MHGAFELLELASTYQYQARRPEKYPDAQDKMNLTLVLSSRGLAVVNKLRGPHSLAAVSAMAIVGSIAYHCKGYARAREVEEKVFEIRAEVLGEHDHFTLQAKDDLAITMAKQGDFSAAARMHDEVRTVQLATLGSLHPQTLETERMLARAWRMGGHLERARELNEDILQRAIRTFGKDHWDTSRAANALWRCLIAQRFVDKAHELQAEYRLTLNAAEQEMLLDALESQRRESERCSFVKKAARRKEVIKKRGSRKI